MKIALFCWRPYHIFSAINMVKNDVEGTKNSTTLFIYNYAGLHTLKDKLEATDLFNDIILVEDYKGHSQYLKKTLGLIFPRIALRHHFSNISFPNGKGCILSNNSFDKIIATSCNSILFEFLRLNTNASMVLYEDGTFSYIADEIPYALNHQYRHVKWLLKVLIRRFNIIGKYVYEPKLVTTNGYKLRALPKISEETYDIQKNAFSYDHDAVLSQYAGKKIIYLDERFPIERFKDDISEDEVFNIMKEFADETILRPHPGNDPGSLLFTVDKANQSWELSCKDILNSDSIIITKTSTAAFTPLMLYGIQAHIIYLAELLFKKTEGVEMIAKNFVRELGYEKIYLPHSLDELKKILNDIH